METVHFTQRVYKSKGTTQAACLLLSVESISFRPNMYGMWSKENLEAAIIAIERGISIRRAAEMYVIPRSTLHDHVSGRVELHTKPGPSPYLSANEEEELAAFLIKCAKMGYPHTRQQILGIVEWILDSKQIDVVVTHGWWERFRKRHPYLTLRTAAPLSYVRAMAQG